MATAAPAQQLFASNTSANIADSLAARIKDPLWMLARQWQTGEFEAENGGRAAVLSIMARELPINTLQTASGTGPIASDTPLDFVIERESNAVSPLWLTEALEYGFELGGDGTRLAVSEYHGRNLDWYHFDIVQRSAPATPPPVTETRMVPTMLTFRGAPHPRWWRFEEGDAYFDSPEDPDPNVLSMLLPEFFFIDINNWYLAPLPQTAGTIREITSLKMVDSFGVTTEIGPSSSAADPEWAMFSLSPSTATSPNDGGGAFLYIPNIAGDVLDNDQVEEIVFTRDEEANLVWAAERLVTLADGTEVRNGDGTATPAPPPSTDPRPRYRLRSDIPPYYIPYVPRFLRQSPTSGETYLRRGRTIEDVTVATQFRSRIVGESWRLNEAEVPRTGVRVRRTHRYARGSDGKRYFWIGRDKQTAMRSPAPGLKFDYLVEPRTEGSA